MTVEVWYWVILILWVLFRGFAFYREDTRVASAGDIILLVLLVLNGFMDAGSPIK
jgi:hypothetical protein